MDYLKQNHLALLVILYLVVSPFIGGSAGVLGALDRTTITNPVTFASDVIFSGGNGAITLTTTNAATSTATIGCIQSYATSTASPVRFTLSPFVGTSTTQGGTSNFLVAAQFGSCPI